MQIAVIGLGHMGRAMAERLIARGFAVRVWNRSRDKAAGLRATVCARPAEAARDADVVLTSLSDDEAVRSVVFGDDGILGALGDGAVHAGTSTVSYALAVALQDAHAEVGRAYLSAPVLGRPEAAAAGQLFVLAGGEARARARCAPVFDAIGQRTFALPDAPQASLAKILVNLTLAGTIELLGEVLAVGEKAGLAPTRLVELLTGTLFGCPAIVGYGQRIAEGAFEPAGFRMSLGLKDVTLALALGDQLRAPLPVASLVRDHLLAALARGGERLDWSGLSTIARLEAGLPAESPTDSR